MDPRREGDCQGPQGTGDVHGLLERERAPFQGPAIESGASQGRDTSQGPVDPQTGICMESILDGLQDWVTGTELHCFTRQTPRVTAPPVSTPKPDHCQHENAPGQESSPCPQTTHRCITSSFNASGVTGRNGQGPRRVASALFQVCETTQESAVLLVSHAGNGGSNPPGVTNRKPL